MAATCSRPQRMMSMVRRKIAVDDAIPTEAFCTDVDHDVRRWLQTSDCQDPMGVVDKHSLNQAW